MYKQKLQLSLKYPSNTINRHMEQLLLELQVEYHIFECFLLFFLKKLPSQRKIVYQVDEPPERISRQMILI